MVCSVVLFEVIILGGGCGYFVFVMGECLFSFEGYVGVGRFYNDVWMF